MTPLSETTKSKSYVRVGDLVQLNNGSIGYVIDPSMSPVRKGEEVKHQCFIRWIDGEYKNQGWISIGTELKEDGIHDTSNIFTLITDETKKKFYKDKHPFVNSIKGTKNILNSDFPPPPVSFSEGNILKTIINKIKE